MCNSVAFMKALPAMVNRKRLWDLAIELRNVFGQEVVGSCHGRRLPRNFRDPETEDFKGWRQSNWCLMEYKRLNTIGSRSLQVREIDVPESLDGIFVSFCQLPTGRFVSGIRFRRKPVRKNASVLPIRTAKCP